MAQRNFSSQFHFSFEKQLVHLLGKFTVATELAKASLVDQGVTYTAVDYGAAGNDITVELINPGDVTSPLSINVVDTAISVSLESTESEAASLVDQGVTYTAIDTGTAGNSITIELLDPLANDSPLSISVVGTDISVSLETDSGGLIITTADDLVIALNADMDASALILASGSGMAALSALAQTSLMGGLDAAIVTDADALVAALLADMDVTALIDVSGSGATPLVALAETPLAGGADSLITDNLPIPYMSMSEVGPGLYQVTLADKYWALLSASMMLETASLADLSTQLAAEDVISAKTVDIRTFAIGSGSPVLTSLAVGDSIYVDLCLRNVR